MQHRMCTLPGVANASGRIAPLQLSVQSVSVCVRVRVCVCVGGGGGFAKEGVKGRRTYFTRCRVAFGERLLDLPPLPYLDLPPSS